MSITCSYFSICLFLISNLRQSNSNVLRPKVLALICYVEENLYIQLPKRAIFFFNNSDNST